MKTPEEIANEIVSRVDSSSYCTLEGLSRLIASTIAKERKEEEKQTGLLEKMQTPKKPLTDFADLNV